MEEEGIIGPPTGTSKAREVVGAENGNGTTEEEGEEEDETAGDETVEEETEEL
jgi:hypothetical protein